jgi:hypothetical protein
MKHTATLKLTTTGNKTVTSITALNLASALKTAGFDVELKEKGKIYTGDLPQEWCPQAKIVIEI